MNKRNMMRAMVAPVLGLMGMAAAGCSTADHDLVWETSECRVTGDARVVDGNNAPIGSPFAGCRIHYFADGQILTVQLMAPGATGNFVAPGNGWLAVNENIQTAEQTSVSVDGRLESLPVEMPANEAAIIYITPEGQKLGGTGTLGFGANILHHVPGSDGGAVEMELSFSGVHFAAAGDAMTGSVSVVAQIGGLAASDGSTGSGNPGVCDQSACDGYSNECANNGVSQAPCYCAAACLCHCSGDACEQGNRDSAQMLGTTCSY
jgi:hypothetical protein